MFFVGLTCAELQFCVVMMQRNLRNVVSYRRLQPAGYRVILNDDYLPFAIVCY